jgi:hypothetical protein
MLLSRRNFCAGLLMTEMVFAQFTLGAESNPPTKAKQDGVWLGLFTERGPGDISETTSLEDKLGKRFASIMWYTDFENPFPLEAAQNAWDHGAVPNVTWEPWSWNDREKIHLKDINAGTWDGYIADWGTAVAKFGKPIFVRWGHEFNGNWYPWCIANNGQDAEAYIAAYRRVHDLVVAAGAQNVIWVWSPNNGTSPAEAWNNPLLAYPGDSYVDWVAIDGYDFDSASSFSDIFSKIYADVIKSVDKPIYIGEFSTGRLGKAKAAWFKDMDESLKTKFPGIKGIVFFNVKKEKDWRLDDSPAALAGVRAVLSSPSYKSQSEAIADLATAFASNYDSYKANLSKKAVSRKNIDVKKIIRDSNGKLDWSGVPAIAVKGKNKFSGKVRFAWDAENLYVKAEFKDPYPMVNQGKNDGIWNGDCMEICLSTDSDADPGRSNFGSTDWQIGIAPADKASDLPCRTWEWGNLKSSIPGARVNSTASPGGYAVEASIPWSALKEFKPEAGMVLGFDFAVDDAGAEAKRSAQWIWNGTSQFYNDPSLWGIITLRP